MEALSRTVGCTSWAITRSALNTPQISIPLVVGCLTLAHSWVRHNRTLAHPTRPSEREIEREAANVKKRLQAWHTLALQSERKKIRPKALRLLREPDIQKWQQERRTSKTSPTDLDLSTLFKMLKTPSSLVASQGALQQQLEQPKLAALWKECEGERLMTLLEPPLDPVYEGKLLEREILVGLALLVIGAVMFDLEY